MMDINDTDIISMEQETEYCLLAIADLIINDMETFQMLDQYCRKSTNRLVERNEQVLLSKKLINKDGSIPEMVKEIVLNLSN